MSKPKSVDQLGVDWKAVGRRIRELRGFDTKQSELAEAVGVAQSSISEIERGQKEMGVVPLLRLARFYGRSIEWILTGNDEGSRRLMAIEKS